MARKWSHDGQDVKRRGKEREGKAMEESQWAKEASRAERDGQPNRCLDEAEDVYRRSGRGVLMWLVISGLGSMTKYLVTMKLKFNRDAAAALDFVILNVIH